MHLFWHQAAISALWLTISISMRYNISERRTKLFAKKNLLLSSGWFQSLDHLEVLQKTLEAITLDAVGGCSRNSIGLLAHGAADWAEENVWAGTGAAQELGTELMDED